MLVLIAAWSANQALGTCCSAPNSTVLTSTAGTGLLIGAHPWAMRMRTANSNELMTSMNTAAINNTHNGGWQAADANCVLSCQRFQRPQSTAYDFTLNSVLRNCRHT
jgi:hypothetical protein